MANENLLQFESGDVIFREGDSGDRMYVLLVGAVDLKKKVDRGETVIKTVSEPNEFFGEMALIDDKPRSATAIAARRTNVLAVDGPAFEAMILSNGKFALKIIKVLSERIRRSNEQVSDLIETMPRERIARGMVDYALLHGERIHEGAVKVSLEALKGWINGHLGIPVDEVEAAVQRFLRLESLAWAPTSAKTHEHLVLPRAFIEANDRRARA